MLRSGDTQFQVLKGKLSKKAHASGVKASVTKAWSERYFIFDYSNGDLFYWKEQPTAEFCKSNGDAEHYKGTRCVLARAKLLAASAGAPLRNFCEVLGEERTLFVSCAGVQTT